MKHPNKYRHDFLQLSVLLTGFNAIELESTGMVEVYFKTVLQRTEPSVVESFFENTRKILALGPTHGLDQAIRSELLPDSAYNGLAKRIILLWYEGLWITKASREVISTESYVQGLMWPAAKTHPSGAKQPGYGSWANLPLTVESTIVNKQKI
jgi:hypothetical protein